VKIPFAAHGRPSKFEAEASGGCFSRIERRDVRWRGGREEHPKTPGVWKRFLQSFQSLRRDVREEHRQPGSVAARPRETCHMADAHGVGMACEDDRDRPGGLQGGRRFCRGLGEDDVYPRPDQFRGEFRHLGRFPPTELEPEVSAFDEI
jgi:hypothetical protein